MKRELAGEDCMKRELAGLGEEFIISIIILNNKCITLLLTYLCLFARWEHRPSTKECHCFLSVAIISISLLVTWCIPFLSVSLCQIFCGLPLRLFPGGFHVMACRVMVSGGFLNKKSIILI